MVIFRQYIQIQVKGPLPVFIGDTLEEIVQLVLEWHVHGELFLSSCLLFAAGCADWPGAGGTVGGLHVTLEHYEFEGRFDEVLVRLLMLLHDGSDPTGGRRLHILALLQLPVPARHRRPTLSEVLLLL